MKAAKVLLILALPVLVLTDELAVATYLEPGDSIIHESSKNRAGFYTTFLNIYCFRGNSKILPHIFQTVHLQLEIENDEFTQYEGPTPEIVKEHHNAQKSIFSINLLSNKKTRLKLNPFNQTCVGIETYQSYKVRLQLIRVDFWRVITLATGMVIFWFSAKLSRNSLFYYLSSVLLGVFASVMILIYLASKLVPRRPMMYGVLVGGWTIAIYFAQMMWENIQVILVSYKVYIFWYIMITGFLSFVICYRLGPPKNKRSKDLIQWSLQILALVLIFFSSDFQEATAAINIILVASYYFPQSWLGKIWSVYRRRFPPKLRLLTNEEYFEQGVRETSKALEDLRRYCSSPECKQWRVVTKLKDPTRFASFMEGSSHILDDEILEYETSRGEIPDSDLSEDEDDISEDEGVPTTRSKYNLLYADKQNYRINGSIGSRQRSYYGSYNQPHSTNSI